MMNGNKLANKVVLFETGKKIQVRMSLEYLHTIRGHHTKTHLLFLLSHCRHVK